MFKKYGVIKKTINTVKKGNLKTEKTKGKEILEAIEKSGEEALSHIELCTSIAANMANLQAVFKDCSDVIFREFVIGTDQVKCIAVYIDGIIKKEEINENLLKPLMTAAKSADLKNWSPMESCWNT